MKIILASGSPRRSALLTQLGLNFEIQPSNINEDLEGFEPKDLVKELALRKAHSVAQKNKNALVIGADTTVILNGKILGKPSGNEEAKSMLKELSGNTHSVFSGVSLYDTASGKSVTFVEETIVRFSKLSLNEIEFYVQGGSPLDKAGAYGIQDDWGSVFVECIEGDYYNVVGLPLNRLYNELKRFKPEVLEQIYTSS